MKSFADALGIELHTLTEPLEDSFASGVAVFCGEDGSLIYASKNYHSYTGYSAEECQEHGGSLMDVLIHPEDRANSTLSEAALQSPGTQLETEYRIIKKGGAIAWVRCCASVVASPLRGRCVLCTFFDITKEREEADRARRENDLLMNTIPGGVAKIVMNEDFRVLLASDGFYRLTGYTREEFHSPPIGGCGRALILSEDVNSVVSAVQEQLNSGTIFTEYRITRKDDEVVWMAVHASKISEEDGIPVVEGVFLDTTRAKNMERQLLRITNSIPGGVAQMHFSGSELIVDYASDGLYRLLGKTREELHQLGNRMSACIHPEDSGAAAARLLEQMARMERDISAEYRIALEDGQTRWCRLDGVCMENSEILECVCTDVTEAKLAQQRMEISEARYRVIFEHTQDIVFDWDMKSGFMFHSAAFEKKFGFSLPQTGTIDYILERVVYEDDRAVLLSLVKQMRDGKDYSEGEYRLRKANGQYIWCRTKSAAVFDKHHNPVRAVGIVMDVDHYIKHTERLQVQARMDLLTGLLNKVTAQTDMEEFLAVEGVRGHHALLLIDIDNFKSINDNFGHMMGDSVLTEISARIRAQFRGDDIVGRMGGDEFAVLLANVTGRESVERRAKQLCSVFRNLFQDWKTKCDISGSIGIAMYPQDGRTLDELYKNADSALYTAKNKGKDQCAFYGD